ncbi:restriction endonuclease [Halobacteriales archaeon QS_4_69_34]|nr:MAG: restriction endonuclease [Halobacteriales archaeon QS_4_69_34]
MTEDWFGSWDARPEELNEILSRNPSLRGMLHGYLAEEKVKRVWFEGSEDVTNLFSPDDHDRDLKGDWILDYEGEEIVVEVKSLQSNHVERIDDPESEVEWNGKFQCDASDRRPVTLPTGETMETTCLVVGQFDLLAINLFEFGGEWRFAFAKNEDLPRTPYSGYTEEQREHLIKGTMAITLPLEAPFHDEPWTPLDETVAER